MRIQDNPELSEAQKTAAIKRAKAEASKARPPPGVGALIRERLAPSIEIVHDEINWRLQELHLVSENLTIMNVYGPADSAAREKKRFLDEVSRRLRTLNSERERVIIGGDWNAVVNPSLDRLGAAGGRGAAEMEEFLVGCIAHFLLLNFHIPNRDYLNIWLYPPVSLFLQKSLKHFGNNLLLFKIFTQ